MLKNDGKLHFRNDSTLYTKAMILYMKLALWIVI